MTGPTLTAAAGGAPLLAPLLAQWDTSFPLLFERLGGLTDAEYRWAPTPEAADLVADADGLLRLTSDDGGQHTRTIAWTLGHLADMCWARSDYVNGDHAYPTAPQPFPGSAAAAL